MAARAQVLPAGMPVHERTPLLTRAGAPPATPAGAAPPTYLRRAARPRSVLSVSALRRGLYEVVAASLLGSILSNQLLVLGEPASPEDTFRAQ